LVELDDDPAAGHRENGTRRAAQVRAGVADRDAHALTGPDGRLCGHDRLRSREEAMRPFVTSHARHAALRSRPNGAPRWSSIKTRPPDGHDTTIPTSPYGKRSAMEHVATNLIARSGFFAAQRKFAGANPDVTSV
jgi:hypothetical protein